MKKDKLKARGIRLLDEQWDKLERVAKARDCTPSDVVRHLINNLKERKGNTDDE